MRHTVRSTIDAFIHYLGDLSGRPTQNIRFPKKLIYYYLSIHRNAVLYDEVKKRKDVDLTLQQTIPCIEMIEVDVVADCPCAPEKGCKWLKSKESIPDLLKPKPDTVITLDGMIKFEYIEWYRFKHVLNGRYRGTRENPYYTFRNVKGRFHLYIYCNAELTATAELEFVAMTGLFKDPLDVINFTSCKKEIICNTLDQDFLIPLELESLVFQKTYNALMSLNRMMLPNSDTYNNDNNDSTSKPPIT